MRRGDIYVASLRPRSGSEQGGTRPVIIVSSDGFSFVPGWRSVVVVPCSTSTSQADRGPTAVPLSAGSGGLARPSIAVCHQVTTLDRQKLTRHLGTLQAHELAAVELGLRAALDL